jgi:DivIVA domain-containing protein
MDAMELSPKAITNVEFHLVRKGYDPDEVRAFLTQVAKGVEALQTQLTNADARARAAVARMQELTASSPSGALDVPAHVATPTPASAELQLGDTDTIAKTLLLAQRTADATIAEAQSKAAAIVSGAEDRARTVVDQADARASVLTREAETQATTIIDKAKTDAVEASAAERARIQAELASMRAERDQLQANVSELGAQLIDHRGRLEQTVNALRQVLDDPRGLKPVSASGLPAPSAGFSGGGQVVGESRRAAHEADPDTGTVFEVASSVPGQGTSGDSLGRGTEDSFEDLRWSGERD